MSNQLLHLPEKLLRIKFHPNAQHLLTIDQLGVAFHDEHGTNIKDVAKFCITQPSRQLTPPNQARRYRPQQEAPLARPVSVIFL
jgi:hypothetical protein